MADKKLYSLLSEQINFEFYSAYLYYSMSSWCNLNSYEGIANWLYVQAQEEYAHGNHINEFLLMRDELPSLLKIDAPPLKFDNVLSIFEQALAHEKIVTERINTIASTAMKQGDHTIYTFIQWYITEQVEEESSTDLLVRKLTAIGSNAALLYDLDRELALRTYVDPFASASAG